MLLDENRNILHSYSTTHQIFTETHPHLFPHAKIGFLKRISTAVESKVRLSNRAVLAMPWNESPPGTKPGIISRQK